MMPEKNDYKELLERLKSKKLTDHDYHLLAAEVEKVVKLTSGAETGAGGRRVVAKLPFGLDIVK